MANHYIQTKSILIAILMAIEVHLHCPLLILGQYNLHQHTNYAAILSASCFILVYTLKPPEVL